MLSKLRTLTLAVACVSHLGAGSAATGAEEPSPEQLVGLAPVLKGSDARFQSIDIRGFIKERDAINLRFRALYRAPDRYLVSITDGGDDTPLLLATDGKMLLYDPVGAVVVVATKADAEFSLNQVGDTLKFYFGFNSGEGNQLLFDIKSLLGGPIKGRQVEKAGDGIYRLTNTSEKGNRLIATIDLAHRCPYTRIEIRQGDADEPFFAVERIAVDAPLGDEEFAFPSTERLASRVTSKVLRPGDGFFKTIGAMALCTRGLYARFAAHNPDLRDAIQIPGFAEVDWGKVEENDRAFSKALRDAVKSRDESPRVDPEGDATPPPSNR